MTHRDDLWDRPCGPSGRRQAAGGVGTSSRPSDARRRVAWATGSAACQGFRTASRTAPDAAASHRADRGRTLLAENLGKPSL